MVSLFKSDLNSVCIFLMIEKALLESVLLFGNIVRLTSLKQD